MVDELPLLTLEGSHVPYIGQFMMCDYQGLPVLQVGLPGDEKGSEVRDGDRQHSGKAPPSPFQTFY